MKFMLKHSLSHIIARRSAWIETIYEDIDLDLGRLDRAEERWRCHQWGLVTAGWRAFAPPRGRLELAAAEHVRSVVRERFSGDGSKRGVSAGFSGKGC